CSPTKLSLSLTCSSAFDARAKRNSDGRIAPIHAANLRFECRQASNPKWLYIRRALLTRSGPLTRGMDPAKTTLCFVWSRQRKGKNEEPSTLGFCGFGLIRGSLRRRGSRRQARGATAHGARRSGGQILGESHRFGRCVPKKYAHQRGEELYRGRRGQLPF